MTTAHPNQNEGTAGHTPRTRDIGDRPMIGTGIKIKNLETGNLAEVTRKEVKVEKERTARVNLESLKGMIVKTVKVKLEHLKVMIKLK